MSGLRRSLCLRPGILDGRRGYRLVHGDSSSFFVQGAAMKIALNSTILRTSRSRKMGVVRTFGRMHVHGRFERTSSTSTHRSNLITTFHRKEVLLVSQNSLYLIMIYHSDLRTSPPRWCKPVLRRWRALGRSGRLRPRNWPFARRKLGRRRNVDWPSTRPLVPVQHDCDPALKPFG